MASKGTRVTVASNAATSLMPTAVESDSSRRTGRTVVLRNLGSATVYLGGGDVTTATGLPLNAGELLTIDLDDGDGLFGRCAAATVEVAVLEVGV